MLNNRYGADKLGYVMVIFAIILIVIAMFISPGKIIRIILLVPAGAVLCYATFRVFSKNIKRRTLELRAMELVIYKIKTVFMRRVDDANEFDNDVPPEPDEQSNEQEAEDEEQELTLKSSEFKYFKCPKCKKPLKVPAGKGYVLVMCPTCSHKFKKHT